MLFSSRFSGLWDQQEKAQHKRRRGVLRVYGWLIIALLLVGGILGPLHVPVAHAASSKLVDFNEIGYNPAPTFVQHHPRVYLVFWGPKWSSDTATITTIENTFQALAGSQYNAILTQYTDTADASDSSLPSLSDWQKGDYVHNDVELMTGPGAPPFQRVIDTSSPPGGIDIGIETSSTGVLWGAQIRNEADRQIAIYHWSVNQDSQVIVFPQPGTTYNTLSQPGNWCGMHVFNTTARSHYAYSLVQYGDQNSSCGSSATDIAFTAVHEYAETATDPVIAGIPSTGSGWHIANSGSFSPQEIADLCGSLESYQYDVHDNVYYLPYLWSNADNACVSSLGREYDSPDSNYPFHGIQSVQSPILNEYLGAGANLGALGPPISEVMPIGPGRVSYFAGGCNINYPAGNCAAIYWSPASGAHVVRASEYQEYVNLHEASGALGFPVTDDAAMNGGSVTYFNGPNGSCGSSKCAGIYWSNGAGSHTVWGANFTEYVHMNDANGPLGFPLSDLVAIPGGTAQYFAGANCYNPGPGGSNSAIYWSGNTGTHEVQGCIYAAYLQQFGGPSNVLGFPLSDEEGVIGFLGDSGRVSYFQGGNCGNPGSYGSNSAIYWQSTGAHEVQGCIYAKYQQIGGPQSKLGFPISNEYTNALGYRESDFANGEIVWENGTAVVKYDTSCVVSGKCN